MRYLGLILLLFIVSACSRNESVYSVENDDDPSLQFDVRSVSQYIKDYTEIYAFDVTNIFNHKVLNVERSEDMLRAKMPVGWWNLVLVGCSESDIRNSIIPPISVNNITMSEIKMWEIEKDVEFWKNEVPEIRTAHIENVEIERDKVTKETASLERNVARVVVRVVESYGLTEGSGHYVTLNDIPLALTWDGGLYYSNATQLYTSGINGGMKGDLTLVKDLDNQNSLISQDSAVFIIPASKVEDVVHSLKLGGYFKSIGGGLWPSQGNNIKEIRIDGTNNLPKANQILYVNVSVKAGIEIEVKVEPWREIDLDYDFTDSYRFEDAGTYTGDTFKVKVVMEPERAWWVNLEDEVNFEIEGVRNGQKTDGTEITVKRKGTVKTTKLILSVRGLGEVKKLDINFP